MKQVCAFILGTIIVCLKLLGQDNGYLHIVIGSGISKDKYKIADTSLVNQYSQPSAGKIDTTGYDPNVSLGIDYNSPRGHHFLLKAYLGMNTFMGQQEYRFKYNHLPNGTTVWVSDTVAAELSYIQLRTGYGVGVKLDENHLYTQVFGFFDYQHASYQLKDSLFFEYRRQQDLLDVNADAYYDIPADDRLSLKDLNQDKTEIFNLGVGINFGFSIGEERGFVFYITPSIKYGVYRHKNLLHNISWGSAGLAGEMSVALGFGGNMNKMISVTRN